MRFYWILRRYTYIEKWWRLQEFSPKSQFLSNLLWRRWTRWTSQTLHYGKAVEVKSAPARPPAAQKHSHWGWTKCCRGFRGASYSYNIVTIFSSLRPTLRRTFFGWKKSLSSYELSCSCWSSRSISCFDEKCDLWRVVSHNRVATYSCKVSLVDAWPRFLNRRELRVFLGMVGYYHQYAQGHHSSPFSTNYLQRRSMEIEA